jgi:ornithine cyclodeaminase
MVLDPATGACIGLVDGASLTAIRTGAGSAVATAALSNDDAETVAILGAGVQAETQLEGVCAVRNIRKVWICARTKARAEHLCARLASRLGIPADVRVVDTSREALKDADIVCTATGARSALFEDRELKPGAHINAIGAYRPDMQEVPAVTVQRARVFVDRLDAAMLEAGDLIRAMEAGLIDGSHITGEIGALLSGELIGRQDRRQITMFKSVGMAAQDAVCSALAVRNAETLRLGVDVKWD